MEVTKNKKNNIKSATLCIIVFFVGFFVHNFFPRDHHLECEPDKFRYINIDFVCSKKPVVEKYAYAALKGELMGMIQQSKEENKITSASIYFRDLQGGPTMGIEEYVKFSPASLLKLSMLLTYLSLAEANPQILERQFSFSRFEEEWKQYYPAQQQIQENISYSINDMLNFMIRFSDNRSYYALLDYLTELSPNESILQKTFFDLGIVDPKDFIDQTISVKAYASIFVGLYNNAFFSEKETSEKALEILVRTDFNEGLVKGLPPGMVVAHKFGERDGLPGGIKQLHDCGIVYFPENPYLLCVMTRGKDFQKLSDTIGIISAMVYKEFNDRSI